MKNYQKVKAAFKATLSKTELEKHAYLGNALGRCGERGLFQGRTPNEPNKRNKRKPCKKPHTTHEWVFISPRMGAEGYDLARVQNESYNLCKGCGAKRRTL